MTHDIPARVLAAYEVNQTCACGKPTRIDYVMGGQPNFEGWELRCESLVGVLSRLGRSEGPHVHLRFHLAGQPVLQLLPDLEP
jgi:hypothetical protein